MFGNRNNFWGIVLELHTKQTTLIAYKRCKFLFPPANTETTCVGSKWFKFDRGLSTIKGTLHDGKGHFRLYLGSCSRVPPQKHTLRIPGLWKMYGTDQSKIKGSLHGRQTTFSSVCRFLFEIFSRKFTYHTLHAWTINDVSLVQIGPL